MLVFINPNMAVAHIYNTFVGELGFISEEDPLRKVGLINTTVQELSAEVYSWHKILWTLVLSGSGTGVAADMQNKPDSFPIHIESTRYSSHPLPLHGIQHLPTQGYGAAMEHHSRTC